jgi:N-acylglucosamine 2-epimerase
MSHHSDLSQQANLQAFRNELATGLQGRNISNPADQDHIRNLYKHALLQDALPFWFPRCVDPQQGGFFSGLDRDGTLIDSDKSVWVQGRMTWMLLRCHQDLGPNSNWIEYAESGIQFIKNHCFDKDGRMFFHVTKEGSPIRKRRYAYSEAFAAIAFAAHANTTQNSESAQKAHELLDRFLKWNFTPSSGSSPKFTDERPMIGLAPRMIALVTAQELRHQLGQNDELNSLISNMIQEIIQYFVKPDRKCVMEQVMPDGEISDHYDGRLLNPGHAIETAWFIMQEGATQKNESWIKLGCQMLEWNWDRAWDKEHGGLLYFTDVDGKPVQEYWHDMKFWWVHSETILATLMAYQLTRKSKYAKMHEKVHNWSFKHFTDSVHGEWYGYLRKDGSVSNSAKGNLWKSFFHYPRSLLWCYHYLNKDGTISQTSVNKADGLGKD